MADRVGLSAIVLALASATSAHAQSADTMIARARALTASTPCPADERSDIVVCGRADATGRYRLPLPDERGVAPRPTAAGLGQAEMLRTPGACAPIGPRRCTKREALSQGLGGGRNPLDQAARLADRLVNGE